MPEPHKAQLARIFREMRDADAIREAVAAVHQVYIKDQHHDISRKLFEEPWFGRPLHDGLNYQEARTESSFDPNRDLYGRQAEPAQAVAEANTPQHDIAQEREREQER